MKIEDLFDDVFKQLDGLSKQLNISVEKLIDNLKFVSPKTKEILNKKIQEKKKLSFKKGEETNETN